MYSRKLGITTNSPYISNDSSLVEKMKSRNAAADFNDRIRNQYMEKMGLAVKEKKVESQSTSVQEESPKTEPEDNSDLSIEKYKSELSDKISSLSVSAKEGLEKLAKNFDMDDLVIIALIVFLLCDKSENDIILLAILLFILFGQ